MLKIYMNWYGSVSPFCDIIIFFYFLFSIFTPKKSYKWYVKYFNLSINLSKVCLLLIYTFISKLLLIKGLFG